MLERTVLRFRVVWGTVGTGRGVVVAAALSVASGLVLLALGIGGGIQREVRKYVERWDQNSLLIMATPGSSGARHEGWSWEEIERIRSGLSQRAEVATYAFVPVDGEAWADQALDVAVLAVDPAYFRVRRTRFASGFAFDQEPNGGRSPKCVVSLDLVKICGVEGAAIGSTLFVGTVPFEVGGVIDCGEETCQKVLGADIWVPLDVARRRFRLAPRRKLLMVKALDGNDIHDLAPVIVALLRECKHLQEGEEDDFQLTFMDGIGRGVRDRFAKAARAVQVAAIVSAALGVGVVLMALVGALGSGEHALRVQRAFGATRNTLMKNLLALVLMFFVLGSTGGSVVASAGVLALGKLALQVPIGLSAGRCAAWLVLTVSLVLGPGIAAARQLAKASSRGKL